MQPKKLLMLFAVFLSGALMGASSCSHNGPKVTIYLSNPGAGGMDYYDENTGKNGFVLYDKTEKFIALSPDDATTLLNYCGISRSSEPL